MRLLFGPLLVACLVVPVGPAAAAPPTCEGQAATIVGNRDQTVTGTEGPDVIVTAGAYRVDAGAGDDVICATGDRQVYVDLGPGRDVFRGGAAPSRVVAESEAGRYVDDVVTGASSDAIEVAGDGMAEDARIDLGGGDQQWLILETTPVHVAVDATRGEASVAGERRWWWTGPVRRYEVVAAARVDFQGTDGPEALVLDDIEDVTPGGHPAGPGAVRMGGGDDYLAIGASGAADGTLDGGAGTDSLTVTALQGHTSVDLGDGAVELPTGTRTAFAGMEKHTLRTRRVTVRGSDQGDALDVVACRADIRTGRGDDTITSWQYWGASGDGILPVVPSCGHHDVVDAGPGADRVSTHSGRDVLRGGPGHDDLRAGKQRDRVHGGAGRDRCGGGETTSACEVRIRADR
jgi:Ca2+-binding RTX toxin-like protein